MLSRPIFSRGVKIVSGVLMVFFVLIPAFYVFSQLNLGILSTELNSSDLKWAQLWIALVNSFQIGLTVIFLDVLVGLPFAFMLTREKWPTFTSVLDAILDLPLAIPSAALGFAIFLFWGAAGLNVAQPGLNMIIFVHITFTFPYVVLPIAATIKNVNVGHEGASATLGAAPLTTFRKITFPSILNGIIAGMIAAFTQSLGETGATLVVMGGDRTVPAAIS